MTDNEKIIEDLLEVFSRHNLSLFAERDGDLSIRVDDDYHREVLPDEVYELDAERLRELAIK